MPTKTLWFIGDAHGKIEQLLSVVDRIRDKDGLEAEIFQLGDMGIGFPGVKLPWLHNFKWIRGNHDWPEKCRQHKDYLGDCGYLSEHKLFYLAGAFSIDAKWRTPGVSWWEDEELSHNELEKAFELYVQAKPEIMISHECPSSIAPILLKGLTTDSDYFNAKLDCVSSRTARMLERMFQAHHPKQWFFGHYHLDKTFAVADTQFTCVAELSAVGHKIVENNNG